MLRQPAVNHRRHARKRMLKGGTIAFNGRHSTLPCVVRDLSESGARLQVAQSNGVPDRFELIIDLDGFEAFAEVAWRALNEVGVHFLAAPSKVAPKRAQTVIMTLPVEARAQPQLRRQEKIVATPAPQTVQQTAARQAGDPQPALANPETAPPATGTSSPRRQIPIVIADDDEDDRQLIEDAFRESKFEHPFAFVENGEELLKYLHGAAPYQERQLPGLILLDLNMPRMDGRTALMHIKTDAKLRRIPVIVLTTSNGEDDIQRTYDLGVSAYLPKPSTFNGLIELVESLNNYWLRFVSLPSRT